MDDIDLPSLPQQQSSRPRPRLLTRKRTLEQYNDDLPPSAASSDPALFSGDEATPGAEDYSNKRKKQMFTGSWWSHEVKANQNDKKREFRRNFDSGVFMGSESSEPPSSDSLGPPDEEFINDQNRIEPQKLLVPLQLSLTKVRPRLKSSIEPENSLPLEMAAGDVAAMKIIQKCLEDGSERVDLSALALAEVPLETPSLNTIVRPLNLVSGMLEYGERFEAHLQLYLGNNLLKLVPKQILDLTNLRILSLRANRLRNLPPGIRSLVNLEVLNVANNKLSYLPFELIELVHYHHLCTIIADSNPFPPHPNHNDVDRPVQWHSSYANTYYKRWRVAPIDPPQPAAHTSLLPSKFRCPTLLETTLRSLARLHPMTDLRTCMPRETPQTVMNALEQLHNSCLDGEYHCSQCDRLIVQPAYETIEWWNVDYSGSFCPPTCIWCTHTDFKRFSFHQSWPVKRMFCAADCGGRKDSWCDEIPPAVESYCPRPE